MSPRRRGLIDRKAQMRRAEELLAKVRCEDIDPRMMVRDLSLSRRQMVDIAKAPGRGPQVLVLDEATSALTAEDVQTVNDLPGRLIAQSRALAGALALFAALFVTYNLPHSRGHSSAVFVQNANEAVAIACVALAQTVPVLMRGLDLSVGAVMTGCCRPAIPRGPIRGWGMPTSCPPSPPWSCAKRTCWAGPDAMWAR
ncbi:MAG: hypothetical protein ACK40I_04320 [Tabrizicola sp.]